MQISIRLVAKFNEKTKRHSLLQRTEWNLWNSLPPFLNIYLKYNYWYWYVGKLATIFIKKERKHAEGEEIYKSARNHAQGYDKVLVVPCWFATTFVHRYYNENREEAPARRSFSSLEYRRICRSAWSRSSEKTSKEPSPPRSCFDSNPLAFSFHRDVIIIYYPDE